MVETGKVSFPNFSDKHLHDAIITPDGVVAHVKASAGVVIPDGAVLIYSRFLGGQLDDAGLLPQTGYPRTWGPVRLVERRGATVAVIGFFGIGAPAAAAVLEELAALGVRQVISMGAAGSLPADTAFGDVVVCNAAIRDEGVSHHYLPTAKFAYPSEALTRRLCETLRDRGIACRSGPTWTIDAPYRETVAEALSYQQEGVITVEMEAAALFAVAEHRGIDVAAVFAISDHLLQEKVWVPGFGSEELRSSLLRLVDVSVDVLAANPAR